MEWQCWVCARACHAAAGHGAGHGGCGSPGGWSGKPKDTKTGLPWSSEVRLQLIPAPATAPGLEEPDGAAAPLHGGGWAHPSGQGSRMPFVLAGTSQPRSWAHPWCGGCPEKQQNSDYKEFSGSFFQTQTRTNCSSLLPGFEKSPRAPSTLKPCFQFLLLSLCSK